MNSNQIKQIETTDTIPELSQAAFAAKHAKYLSAYYILHELFKAKPAVKLKIAVEHLSFYQNISQSLAYRYLETPTYFWQILPKKKFHDKYVKLTCLNAVCLRYGLGWISNILPVSVKLFRKSIKVRKALLFQNCVCKKGAKYVVDEFGRFGRHWIKMPNGKMMPMSNSKGEIIIERDYNYPVSRDTIVKRTNISKTSQHRYADLLRRYHTGFQTFYNYEAKIELTPEEYFAIVSGNCNIQLLDKIFEVTNFEPLGKKFKARRVGKGYFIVEQIQNSYQDFTIRAKNSKNKVRKFNQKLRKIANKMKLVCSVLSKKLNNFNFGPRVKSDGLYFEGARTIRQYFKEAFWVKIENHKRKIFSALNTKDFLFKDVKIVLFKDSITTIVSDSS